MARTRRRIALPQNLRARIIASLVAVGLLPILVALALNIAQSGGSRGVVDDHFQLLIGNTSNGIKQSLERGGILTQMVAQDPVLRDADSGRDELEDRLVYFNGLLPQFHHLTVVSRSGTVLASSTYNYRGAWEVQGVFRAASAGQPAISPAHLSLRSQEPAVTFAAPVETVPGQVSRVVVGELSISSITGLAVGLDVGEGSETFVLNSLGQIIASPQPNQLMHTRDVKNGQNVDSPTVLKLASDQGEMLYAMAPVTVTGMTESWLVVLRVPTAQAYAYVNRTTRLMLFVALGVVILVIVVSLLLGESISRPVRRVITAARGMATGDLAARATVSQGGEVGELARSFNSMANELETRIRYTDNIAESMIDSLMVTTPEGIIQRVNRATLDMLGYEKNEILGKPLGTILREGPDSGREILAMLDSSGAVGETETTYLTRDQRLVPVSFAASSMRDGTGNIEGIVCVAQDITERKRRQEDQRAIELRALAQSKLATLGEVATGLAHEINQPLTYISTIGQVILEDLRVNQFDPVRAESQLTESYRQVGRINRIIQHLRIFGRADDGEMAPVDLETTLDNTLLLLGQRIRLASINLVIEVAPNTPNAIGSANQLEQVFINLLQNSVDALEASPAGGNIKVKLGEYPSEDLGRPSVRIEFCDDGSGISEENLGKIFDPFFTTKPVGQGTGLGLSIVYGIIRDHGGTITCESGSTTGTRFIITLPAEGGDNV
ncbi:MAG: PAS domain S-box protein [Chloroflexi bacterium]|nr:PAS domain S-box protein [Chloroflexota bacterium]